MRMKLSTRAIVSNTDMIKKYKSCREKTEVFGTIFVLKNNQPDAVLFSITEYKRFSALIEYMEGFEENEIQKIIECLPKEGNRRRYSIAHLRDDIE